jgi:hypothetical protein
MATLAAMLVDAAAGQRPLLRHGVSPPRGPRVGAHGLPVADKIGWLDNADNDVAARRRDLQQRHRGRIGGNVRRNCGI